MEELVLRFKGVSLEEYTVIFSVAQKLTMLEYKLGHLPRDPSEVVKRLEQRVERMLEAQRSKSFVENPAPPS